jgi:hypothetical protein
MRVGFIRDRAAAALPQGARRLRHVAHGELALGLAPDVDQVKRRARVAGRGRVEEEAEDRDRGRLGHGQVAHAEFGRPGTQLRGGPVGRRDRVERLGRAQLESGASIASTASRRRSCKAAASQRSSSRYCETLRVAVACASPPWPSPPGAKRLCADAARASAERASSSVLRMTRAGAGPADSRVDHRPDRQPFWPDKFG